MVSHLLLNESSRLNLVNTFFRQHCSNFFVNIVPTPVVDIIPTFLVLLALIDAISY